MYVWVMMRAICVCNKNNEYVKNERVRVKTVHMFVPVNVATAVAGLLCNLERRYGYVLIGNYLAVLKIHT